MENGFETVGNMSTFDGFLREYPLISIDRFTRENYTSMTYFLSHCHVDHMEGLRTLAFRKLLETRGFSKIYLSHVSRTLLINDRSYSHLAEYLEAIPLEQPTLISIPSGEGVEELSVVVTLLPAGHCPGSVMFFFEGPHGNVLYTGDFRIEKGGAERLPHINYENGRVKPIKTLYLDTTFCDVRSLYFPTRQQSVDAIVSLVESWINKGPDRVVYFRCPAKFGYESVFIALYDALKIKIHIDQYKYLQYENIPELEECITLNSRSTQIHACYMKCFETNTRQHGITPCGYHTKNGNPVKLRVIKPCAWSFAENIQLNDIISKDFREKLHRVCFPTHSSLTELWDIVSYIRPQAIHANVIPEGKIEEEVLNVLTPIIENDTASIEPDCTIPPLGVLKPLGFPSSIPSSGSLSFSYNVLADDEVFAKKKSAVEACQVDGQSCPTIEILSEPWEEMSSDSDSSEHTEKIRSSSELNLDSYDEEINNFYETNRMCENPSTINQKSTSISSIPEWQYSPPADHETHSPASTSLSIKSQKFLKQAEFKKKTSSISTAHVSNPKLQSDNISSVVDLGFQNKVALQQSTSSGKNFVKTSQLDTHLNSIIELSSGTLEEALSDSDNSHNTGMGEKNAEMNLDSSDEVDCFSKKHILCGETVAASGRTRSTSFPEWKYSPPPSPPIVHKHHAHSNMPRPFNIEDALKPLEPEQDIGSSLSLASNSCELQVDKACFRKNPNTQLSSMSFCDTPLLAGDDDIDPLAHHPNAKDGLPQFAITEPQPVSHVDKVLDKEHSNLPMSSAAQNLEMLVEAIENDSCTIDTDASSNILSKVNEESCKETFKTNRMNFVDEDMSSRKFMDDAMPSKTLSNQNPDRNLNPSVLQKNSFEFDYLLPVTQKVTADYTMPVSETTPRSHSFLMSKKQKMNSTNSLPCTANVKGDKHAIIISSDSESEIPPTQNDMIQRKSILSHLGKGNINFNKKNTRPLAHAHYRSAKFSRTSIAEEFSENDQENSRFSSASAIDESPEITEVAQTKNGFKTSIPLITIDD